MTGGFYLVEAALIAVLVDRFILERSMGRTRLFAASATTGQPLIAGCIVTIMLAAATAGAGALDLLILLPLSAPFLFAVMLVSCIVFAAFAGEAIFSKRFPFEPVNRLFSRAAVVSSLLGLMTVVPLAREPAGGVSLLFRSTATAVQGGSIYLLILFVFNGIWEKATPPANSRTSAALARELVAAGLLAMVLRGLSYLRLFG
jgi:Na+-translocating ferredoxin:NAD+ oxidoreductase RnfA subunit